MFFWLEIHAVSQNKFEKVAIIWSFKNEHLRAAFKKNYGISLHILNYQVIKTFSIF